MDYSTGSAIPMGGRANRLQRFAVRRLHAALSDLTKSRLRIELPGGYRFECGPRDAEFVADWTIRKWNALVRIASSGVLGFAEGFINAEWDTSDLRGLLRALATELDDLNAARARRGPSRLLARLQHWMNANTRRGSRRNIAFHYDLGNAFYETWLDSSMTYSSALFEKVGEALAEAQDRKYRRICDTLNLKPGDRVLEIGCGWGGFAEVAARDYGCHVTGLTLSREQHDYARTRLERAGLAGKAEIRMQDYRDVSETFDAIASIEMFEAVGEANWPTYFDRVSGCLNPGGRAALQIITIREDQFEHYRRSVDFIQKYVFPGGVLPPPSRIQSEAVSAGLQPAGTYMFGPSYARTLACWHEAYRQAWPRIRDLGFDERFDRIWRYYLSYCEAGFAEGRIDVGQFVFQKPA
ncbi:cyclopropane-fatty-acyl-phospholipid synthase family protein [Maricaulis sp.]|uniref:SAM-dependent methyltransferase n=1 Tax=Maricaulis sp. TaxID=1486257 RepID=UPI00261004CE|nr:cyclopropane-fatty-acyl-phospholipid synthase family protein [Maricaulis sp.]